MSQIMNIQIRASEKGLGEQLKPYFQKGWRVLSKQRGSWWGKIGNSYNWNITLEKYDEVKKNVSVADELIKLKKLLDEGAITENEYLMMKERLMKQ